jgi:hypothetical protein
MFRRLGLRVGSGYGRHEKRDYEYFLRLIELAATHLVVEDKRRSMLH